MQTINKIYLLDNKPVNRQLWLETLHFCIAEVQKKAFDLSTKQAIKSAIFSDLSNGMTSIVNGRQFAEIIAEERS